MRVLLAELTLPTTPVGEVAGVLQFNVPPESVIVRGVAALSTTMLLPATANDPPPASVPVAVASLNWFVRWRALAPVLTTPVPALKSAVATVSVNPLRLKVAPLTVRMYALLRTSFAPRERAPEPAIAIWVTPAFEVLWLATPAAVLAAKPRLWAAASAVVPPLFETMFKLPPLRFSVDVSAAFATWNVKTPPANVMLVVGVVRSSRASSTEGVKPRFP